jgi:hypothetical protein
MLTISELINLLTLSPHCYPSLLPPYRARRYEANEPDIDKDRFAISSLGTK